MKCVADGCSFRAAPGATVCLSADCRTRRAAVAAKALTIETPRRPPVSDVAAAVERGRAEVRQKVLAQVAGLRIGWSFERLCRCVTAPRSDIQIAVRELVADGLLKSEGSGSWLRYSLKSAPTVQ